MQAEVVAVEAEAPAAGLVYALVDSAAALSQTGDARTPLTLRLGTGGCKQVLPLGIFSFKTLRQPLLSAEHEVEGGSGETAAVNPRLDLSSGYPVAESSVGSAALVEAVAAVLAQANVPLNLEQRALLAHNLKLQTELDELKSSLESSLVETKLASDELMELKESNTCQICLSRRVDALLVGCGHLMCRQCVPHCNGKCPFCRREFAQAALFYAASPDGSGA